MNAGSLISMRYHLQRFIADPHLRMGLVPGDGGMTWPALTGLMRSKEYLFLGSRIPADDAVTLSLATRVVSAPELLAEALQLAHRLAVVPTQALRDTKHVLNSYLEVQLDVAYERALSGELACLHSDEHRAAVASARAKLSSG